MINFTVGPVQSSDAVRAIGADRVALAGDQAESPRGLR